MAEELLSLKWNNHQSHFVDILTFLREQEIFIDATLACGGKLYPAHKFVLSTCSDYFKQMFTKNPNKHPIVFMKDVSCRDLEALLDFMYNGEVNVPQSSLGSLIKTAEGLQIKGLAVPDDPPISNKREAALLRDRRELKTVRDNSYSPSPKRLRGRDKSPPLYSSRSKSPNSMSLHPSTTAAVASLAAVVSAEANAAAADEDSRTSAISDHSAAHVAGNSTAPKPNANSHLNSEDSASLSDNISRVSNRDPSPGPSGLKNILLHSKEEELDIKQEDVVDLGDAEGDWGGGDDGRDESLDDGGGGDSLTSENNAPNFSDVLGPPSDGSLNTSGDPAMSIQAYLAALRQAIPDDLITKGRGISCSSGKKVACPICGNIMARTYYPTHLRTHTGEKPFACPSCPYRTGDRSNLNHHMLRHKFYHGPPDSAATNQGNKSLSDTDE